MKTVAQLVKELQALPQDLYVYTDHTDPDSDIDEYGWYNNYTTTIVKLHKIESNAKDVNKFNYKINKSQRKFVVIS